MPFMTIVLSCSHYYSVALQSIDVFYSIKNAILWPVCVCVCSHCAMVFHNLLFFPNKCECVYVCCGKTKLSFGIGINCSVS